MTELKNGDYKHGGVTIQKTPTEKYPDMVTFIKTTKRARGLLNKRFLTLEQSIEYIDKWDTVYKTEQWTQRLEQKEAIRAKNQLEKTVPLQAH